MSQPKLDLLGKRFGRLVVVESVPGRWCCLCDCGKYRDTTGTNLRTGNTTSCGCRKLEYAHIPRTHGKSKTKVFAAWNEMLQRCTNPRKKNYTDYGGRGISVCDRWQTFENFLADMGEPLPGASLDRINNNGNYEPSNCRWASRTEQSRNRRNCRMYEIGGISKPLSEWCELHGMNYYAVYSRLEKGWDIEAALTTPPIRTRSKK